MGSGGGVGGEGGDGGRRSSNAAIQSSKTIEKWDTPEDSKQRYIPISHYQVSLARQQLL